MADLRPRAPGVGRLADVLAARRDEIVRRWVERVEREAGERMPRPALVDSLPAFLDAMERALRQAGDPPGRAHLLTGAAEVASEHGRQRFALHVDVTQLVREYGVLREVVLAVAREAGLHPSIEEFQALSEVFDAGVTLAAAEYTAAREAALAELQARYQHIADRAPAMVFVKDEARRYTFVNRFLGRMLGRPRREVLGKLAEEVLPPALAAEIRDADERTLRGEDVETELTVPTADGERHVRTVSFPMAIGPGGAPAMVGIGLDVTEAHAAEAEARRAAELLELGDAFFELDREFRVVRVNRNQERLSRRPRSETLGGIFWELWPETADPAGAFWREYHRVMEERIPREFEAYFAPLDLWTAVTAYPVTGGGIAVFFRDVTLHKRAERRLEEARAFDQQLVGIASHDLRNPVSAIRMAAELLLREELTPAQRRTVARIHTSADRAARMVRDLLDVTRARLGGGIPIEPRPVDLHRVVADVVDELRAANPDRALRLDVRGWTGGTWDADRLAQVVGNLASNALRHAASGTPVSIAVTGEADLVRVEVSNQGQPIPPEQFATLFQPGGGLGSGAKSTVGAGLGLFIVDRLVAAHGGRVEVRSSAETGTIFSVILPREAPPAG